jgi:hypothetical protein
MSKPEPESKHDRDHDRHPHPKPRHGLPDAELASFARLLIEIWQSGIPGSYLDSAGGNWSIVPIRDAEARLEAHRYLLDAEGEPELAGSLVVHQPQFAVDAPETPIAARILAVTSA